jgi:uncharacterized protein with HEPN domain
MPPESASLLRDMLDAAESIAEFVRGKSARDYLASKLLHSAVQWNFAVIGEALAALNKVDPTTSARISEYPRIIAFRNQLIHGYRVIDHDISWTIIQTKLPILICELRTLLQAQA